MFEEEAKIVSNSAPEPADEEPLEPGSRRLWWVLGLALVFTVGLAGWYLWRYRHVSPPAESDNTQTGSPNATVTPALLPNFDLQATTTPGSATSTLAGVAVEYLSFADFYEAPDNAAEINFPAYSLPQNVKIDVMNYYDLSRKLDLDPGLDALNREGFAILNNPWAGEAGDFFGVYDQLNAKQIPLLITSDFLIYHQQNILKKAFKSVEENVFFDNLWDINKQLYLTAKARYESRLAAIGDVNDPILEGQRLETAFFAVALELLKPDANQLAAKDADNRPLFLPGDVDRFYFVVAPYLRDDVLAEVRLIRAAQAVQAKSPVLLYHRNYQEFSVPADYRANAKLNNFYLTSVWLNSVFPLNYRGPACADCLLDGADWRISMTAASLISHDFSNLPELKNRWARIYKVVSYFKGLREDLSYVHYRDALAELFGEEYEFTEIFGAANPEAASNLEKLRARLLEYDFPAIAGGLDKAAPATRTRLGFKMLAEPYWPNSYLFGRLIQPAIGVYTATSTPGPLNVTACEDRLNSRYIRCRGTAYDIVGLAAPLSSNPAYQENSRYLGYEAAADRLKAELSGAGIWHQNNYWSTLSLIRAAMSFGPEQRSPYGQSAGWQRRLDRLAASSWVNLQVPLEKYNVRTVATGQGLDNFSRWTENSHVEPNLPLINEMMAQNEMLLKMFTALQLDTSVRLATQEIRNHNTALASLRNIVLKEMGGQSLSPSDQEVIANYTKQAKATALAAADKQLTLRFPAPGGSLKQDISRLQLLVVTHQDGDNRVFSVGPVWDFRESR